MRHYELVTIVNILFLLVFLLSLLFPHSSLAALQLKDNVEKNYKVRAENVKGQLQDMFYLQDEGEKIVQRKDLHEVHSGTNPIGNSVPQEKKKNTRTQKLQRFP
ncbi:hypothetical protein TorRG33x02_058010 [Trema orientale]|uniref:Transmembrane protein n=1 Tax=Trema orientale TaxID=63057 RepID=A0A2P5FL92_TREOI|nr:hypothetical protein TorRG33x02_058010 [Trema orientale]